MALVRFRKLFQVNKAAVIGMVHTRALPGTPLSEHNMQQLVDMACREVEIYSHSQVDGVLVENMFDIPYLHRRDLGPEVVACMTRICTEVRSLLPSHIPCGLQILAGGNKEALAVSKACGLQFIRAEGFVFSHIADEGLIEAQAGELLRYRKAIDAEDVLIFTDIKKKHSAHAITSDIDVVEFASAAKFFLADAIILTGAATGQQADVQQLKECTQGVNLPTLIGSGITRDNVEQYMDAHGFIVGSHFKAQGSWKQDLELERVKSFMDHVKILRSGS